MLDLFTLFSTMGLQEEIGKVEGLHAKVIKEDEPEEAKQGPENALEAAARNIGEIYEGAEAAVLEVVRNAGDSEVLGKFWSGSEEVCKASDNAAFVIDLTLPPPPLRVRRPSASEKTAKFV